MSPAFGADDVGALLGDLGVEVTLGAVTVQGILDHSAQLLRGDVESEAVERAPSVLIAAGALGAGLVQGAAITVDGTAYLVREPVTLDDGALQRLFLVAA